MIWSLFILAAITSAPIDPPSSQAVPVFACDFSADHDRNFDNWPDDWTRRTGPGYPFYVKAAIEDDTAADVPVANRQLAVHMDGGAAALQYKHIPVGETFSYVLACRIHTDGLSDHQAFVRLTAFNAKQEVMETFESQRVTGTQPWTQVQIGPWAPNSADVESVVLSLHVEPRSAGALFGTAYFDDLSFARLPRITLECQEKFNLFKAPVSPVVRCSVSGISNKNSLVTFQLFDEQHRSLDPSWKVEIPLKAKPMHVDDESGAQQDSSYAGEASWAPPINEVGFYTVEATVTCDDRASLQRSLTLAVMHDFPSPATGIYGWCLPQGENNLHVKQLAQLVSNAGVNWVKFPVWFADQDTAKADRIAWFAERLSNLGIQLVAVLGTPPADAARELLGDAGGSAIALVFAEREVWQRLLNPVITRLSLKVRWWQIGDDHDASFVGFSRLEDRVREIHQYFERFGQEVQLGLAWNWLDERPQTAAPPWSFFSYFSDPPLTARELHSYIKEEQQQQRLAWILLEPLAADHDLETRARDLVLRMVVAKTAGAQAAFIPDPFDQHTGLLNPDGTPRELFLPWRTAAMLLANSQYLGEWQLPSGSQNRVFAHDGRAIIVLWNDQPVTETLYVGEANEVQQIDVWGRISQPDCNERKEQILHVSKLPTFIVGANLPISRMRIDFAFDKSELSSAFGVDQTANMRIHNYFPQGISGEIVLKTPDLSDVWTVQPERIRFKAAIDEVQTHPFQVFLRNNAPSGPQAVQIDVEVRADRQYQFSIYRTIRVGTNDVAFEIFPSLTEDGSLIVEQHLINRSDQEVSFNCLLFLPGIGRERRQVLHATRGRRTDVYVIPDGQSLLGTTLWLRAEEIGGSGRLLNYYEFIDP